MLEGKAGTKAVLASPIPPPDPRQGSASSCFTLQTSTELPRWGAGRSPPPPPPRNGGALLTSWRAPTLPPVPRDSGGLGGSPPSRGCICEHLQCSSDAGVEKRLSSSSYTWTPPALPTIVFPTRRVEETLLYVVIAGFGGSPTSCSSRSKNQITLSKNGQKSYNSEIPFLQLTHILTLQDYHWEATNLSRKPLASSWLYQLPTQNEISKSDVLIPSPKHYVRRGYYCYVVPYASIFTSSGSTTFKFLTYASRYQGLLKKVTRVS